jgi:glycosyltransferase involved in cell wall biosynthesis
LTRDRIDRAVLVSTHYPPFAVGGAEISTQLLAQALAQHGIDVVVLTLNHASCKLMKEYPFPNLAVWYAPLPPAVLPAKLRALLFRSVLFYVALGLVILSLIWRNRPQILHIQDRHSLIPGVWAASLARVPVTFTVRDPFLLCPSGMCLVNGGRAHPLTLRPTLQCMERLHEEYGTTPTMRLQSKLLAVRNMLDTRLKRWAYRQCGGIVFVSQGLRRLFEASGLIHPNACVVYNPAPVRNGCGSSTGKLDHIRSLKASGVSIVTTVGKLSYGKGTYVLLNAIQQVLHHVDDVAFVFAGTSHIKQNVPESAVPYVHLLGRLELDEVYELYTLADIVCQPSIWPEPFSRTLLEAMAFRKPIVATAVGGTPEAVRDGENGLLVPPSDSDALARALCSLLCAPDRASAMGEAGYSVVTERFTSERTLADTLSHYTALQQRGIPR